MPFPLIKLTICAHIQVLPNSTAFKLKVVDSKKSIPLLEVTSTHGFEQQEDVEVRHEYCLDNVYQDDGRVVGTLAVITQLKPEIECRNRPCLTACCPRGHVWEAEGVCREVGLSGNATAADRNATVWRPTLINRRNGEFSDVYKVRLI